MKKRIFMRPKGSTKDRLPIFEEDFNKLITLLKKDKHIHKTTKAKFLFAFTLLYYSGCRVSEIARLTFYDIDFLLKTGHLALANKTKTKKPRTIFFTPSSLKEIQEIYYAHFFEKYHLYIFSSKQDKNRHIQTGVFNAMLNTYIKKKLGILYTTHSFRSGIITRIVEKTGNVKTAQDFIGHTSTKTTLKYLSTTPTKIQEALGKVFEVANSLCQEELK